MPLKLEAPPHKLTTDPDPGRSQKHHFSSYGCLSSSFFSWGYKTRKQEKKQMFLEYTGIIRMFITSLIRFKR
jgi:hypothetical protein